MQFIGLREKIYIIKKRKAHLIFAKYYLYNVPVNFHQLFENAKQIINCY